MRGVNRLGARYRCPVELAVDLVGGKWKTVLLARLKERPHRYGELRKLAPGLSDKMLTSRLAELQELGFVARVPATEPGRDAYALTKAGERLRPVLDALYRYGLEAAADRAVVIEEAGSPLTR